MTEAAPPTPGVVFVTWLRHFRSFVIPGTTLAFLLLAPFDRWWMALPFLVPGILLDLTDDWGGPQLEQPHPRLPAAPFDALLYLLSAIQVANVLLLARLVGGAGVLSFQAVVGLFLVMGSSANGIVTAHELIHRQKAHLRLLGRLLMSTVLYEHFYTEHLRGHHVRVGTADDPATARFGERYEAFFRRTVPAQLRSAWRLETTRLGDAEMSLFDPRQLGNRVLHGLVLEWSFALAILGFLGLAAFVAFLVQAFMAVRLLEAVNYFEHWGLQRKGERVQPVDSWDTHGWFTYYGLIGLSRHADHHAYPIRPYQKLRVWEEAPMLPYGYVGMVDLVLANDDEFQRLATTELGRRRLGPFAPAEGESANELPEETALAALEEAREREARPGPGIGLEPAMRRFVGLLTTKARIAIAVGAVLLLTALGAHWETGGAEIGLLPRVLLHGWMAAAIVGTIVIAHQIRARWDNETLAFSVALTALAVVGFLTDALIA